MAEFKDNSPEFDRVVKNYIPFAETLAVGLIEEAEARRDDKVFQRGVLIGLLSCLSNVIFLSHPEVAEEKIIQIARRITRDLRQNPKIRDLIGEQHHG